MQQPDHCAVQTAMQDDSWHFLWQSMHPFEQSWPIESGSAASAGAALVRPRRTAKEAARRPGR
jgi:hypothetical protein